ncbi:MAG: hypothetical protein RQ745_10095 [Longimicrobiales bacterium]|nr:hypothetical protein [Longimicrobiales bacterium]
MRDVTRRHADGLMALPGVLAVGAGQATDGRDAVVVTLRRTDVRLAGEIPDELDGYPIVIRFTDTIRVL